MARRPPPGRCVHCLLESVELTWDHVFPRAWYPDNTPENLEKWKIPSCLACNQLHSKSEGDLLTKLALSIDPDDPLSSGIVQRALRATRAAEGRDPRDAELREARRKAILERVLDGDEIPRQAIYPGFGPVAEQPANEQVAIPVSAAAIHRLAEKVVRGLIYLNDSRFVEEPFKIEQFVLDDEGSRPIRQALAKFGETFERGPGIRVTRAVTPDDRLSGLYEVEIWGRFKMYVSVMDSSRENVN